VCPALAINNEIQPTFNRDVAPILYEKCARCHRPGEVAPFSLLTYSDAAKRASLIATVTGSRIMPPWKPDPGPVPFLNEGRLSDPQIVTLRKWAEAGAPEGDRTGKPPVPHFSEGWQFGEPDEVYAMPASVQIPADGPDIYRCFVLSFDSFRERYVSAFEFRPGNRRVVHHAILFVDTSGMARQLDAETPEPGYSCVGAPGFQPDVTLGIWAPGWPMPPLPAGVAQTIPKGADVVVQMHYHPSGKAEVDRSSLGLKLTEKPQRNVHTLYVYKRQLDIAAGDSHHLETFSTILPVDMDLVSIGPHAHYIAKDLIVDARRPDGSVIRLVHIADWNFNWQGFYYYSHPIRLPRKTEIKLSYVYDNSAGNPHNPSHPPQRVVYGEKTTDEMGLAILGVTSVRGNDEANFQRILLTVMAEQVIRDGRDVSRLARENRRLRFLFRLFDRNHDGKLDDSERRALVAFLDGTANIMGSGYWPFIRGGVILTTLGILAALVLLITKIARRRGRKVPAREPTIA